MQKRTLALVAALFVSLPALAMAQRKSPLADAPAVRNRLELRAKRAELGAGMGTTLNQDFWHAVTFNVRAGFHFNDWLGIGALVALNVSPDMKTGFHERLLDVLPTSATGNDRAPVKSDAEASMSKIGEMFALQLEATPFTGKYSMFGKLFYNYDFYGFLGPGFIDLKSNGESHPCSGNTGPACNVSGFKPGVNFGIGMHTYINQFLGVNVELRDILIQNNPAGRDTSGDKVADSNDMSWDSNYMLMINLVLLLPTSAPISP